MAVTRKRTPASAAILEKVRARCLAIEGAVEKLSHGEPTWFTGPKGKVFAMFDDHHHGAAHVSVWIPAPPGVQAGLVRAEPERYFVPPYVGHKGWVAIVLDTRPKWSVVGSMLEAAFALVSGPRRR